MYEIQRSGFTSSEAKGRIVISNCGTLGKQDNIPSSQISFPIHAVKIMQQEVTVVKALPASPLFLMASALP